MERSLKTKKLDKLKIEYMIQAVESKNIIHSALIFEFVKTIKTKCN